MSTNAPTDGSPNNSWEDIVHKVCSIWTGKSKLDESSLGLLVANAVTNYMSGVVLLGDGIEDNFECFLVDAVNLVNCAHIGPAKPHMNAIAPTVVSMMTRPNSINAVNKEWKASMEMRFLQAYTVSWVVLSMCKSNKLIMLLVPKVVVDWWTDTVVGGSKSSCPAGIVAAMKKLGWTNEGNDNPYQSIVPFEFARIMVKMATHTSG